MKYSDDELKSSNLIQDYNYLARNKYHLIEDLPVIYFIRNDGISKKETLRVNDIDQQLALLDNYLRN